MNSYERFWRKSTDGSTFALGTKRETIKDVLLLVNCLPPYWNKYDNYFPSLVL